MTPTVHSHLTFPAVDSQRAICAVRLDGVKMLGCSLSTMSEPQPQYHVARAADMALAAPRGPAGDHSAGLSRATLVGRAVGAVHTGLALAEIEPGGHVGTHLHSTEQSFYVLSGHPTLIIEGHSYRLSRDECGLLPVGVAHGYRNEPTNRRCCSRPTRRCRAPAAPPTPSGPASRCPSAAGDAAGHPRPAHAHALPPRPRSDGRRQPQDRLRRQRTRPFRPAWRRRCWPTAASP